MNENINYSHIFVSQIASRPLANPWRNSLGLQLIGGGRRLDWTDVSAQAVEPIEGDASERHRTKPLRISLMRICITLYLKNLNTLKPQTENLFSLI